MIGYMGIIQKHLKMIYIPMTEPRKLRGFIYLALQDKEIGCHLGPGEAKNQPEQLPNSLSDYRLRKLDTDNCHCLWHQSHLYMCCQIY